MKLLARTGLLLALMLVMVSAYLRLDNSGIGCPDWPDCYARIGTAPAATAANPQEVYQQLAADSLHAESWATPAHRLVASLLGLCTLGLAIIAMIRRRRRLVAMSLLTLTVFLAVIGIRSGGLHNPAIVMANLAGGFLMVGLLGWLAFTEGGPAPRAPVAAAIKKLAVAGLALCAIQILLGGLTSANFAATACASVPDCNGSYLPGAELWLAMDLSRERVVNADGFVIGAGERADIQKLHRLAAVAALIAMLLILVKAWREHSEFRGIAITIAILCGAEFVLGVATVLTDLPITIAVAHNWLAALLLLSLLRLISHFRT